jgi:hypothetical protein
MDFDDNLLRFVDETVQFARRCRRRQHSPFDCFAGDKWPFYSEMKKNSKITMVTTPKPGSRNKTPQITNPTCVLIQESMTTYLVVRYQDCLLDMLSGICSRLQHDVVFENKVAPK